ncbi:hypothetical protein EX30DRAFT_386280 [Ascodesmis nigricans]|uniref:Uncharacterized protein n=1 Tax=Ascodesmis nigricans TaxID=341454 RepID=A0A4S2MLC4_9PEZI|nr:hypothetical protein EX30DRAFT_386280 [Ascodesmis nigricans]
MVEGKGKHAVCCLRSTECPFAIWNITNHNSRDTRDHGGWGSDIAEYVIWQGSFSIGDCQPTRSSPAVPVTAGGPEIGRGTKGDSSWKAAVAVGAGVELVDRLDQASRYGDAQPYERLWASDLDGEAGSNRIGEAAARLEGLMGFGWSLHARILEIRGDSDDQASETEEKELLELAPHRHEEGDSLPYSTHRLSSNIPSRQHSLRVEVLNSSFPLVKHSRRHSNALRLQLPQAPNAPSSPRTARTRTVLVPAESPPSSDLFNPTHHRTRQFSSTPAPLLRYPSLSSHSPAPCSDSDYTHHGEAKLQAPKHLHITARGTHGNRRTSGSCLQHIISSAAKLLDVQIVTIQQTSDHDVSLYTSAAGESRFQLRSLL